MRLYLAYILILLVPALALGAREDFSSAHSVEVFRVAPPWDKGDATRKMFHGQKIIAGPRLPSNATSRALARDLERVYPIDRPPVRCAFVPRYGVRLHRLRETVEVLVCPHCAEVEFTIGKRVRRSFMSSELLSRLRSLFPDYPLRDDEA